jgi:hypothetical protein
MAGWGPAALLVVLVNAWVVAVGERSGAPRGLRMPRFPLGRRLMTVEPSLAGLGAVVLALVALCTRSLEVTAWVALLFGVLGIEGLRRAAWYLVPAAALIHGLLTMSEFHTLGDLLRELRGGLAGLAWLLAQAVLVCGPLLRTDVGSLGWFGRSVAMVASLPGYLAAGWLAGQVPAAAALPAPILFLAVLLAGGVVQSLILAVLSFAVAVSDRPAHSASPASPYRVGLALVPIFLPLVLLAAMPLLPWPAAALAAAAEGSPETWTAALIVLLLVPAVPAAALVGAALDGADGRRGARFHGAVALSGLGVWLAIGPQLMPRLLAADGPVARLAELCGLGGAEQTLHALSIANAGEGPVHLLLLGLPSDVPCRAMTGLVLAAAWLAARRVRHSRARGRSLGWTGPGVLLAAAAGTAWGATAHTELGPVGAVLGCAAACALMFAVDLVRGDGNLRVRLPDEQEASLVPDQRDRRREDGAQKLPGGRRAADLPEPAPRADAAVPAAPVREAIT